MWLIGILFKLPHLENPLAFFSLHVVLLSNHTVPLLASGYSIISDTHLAFSSLLNNVCNIQ